MLLKPLIKMNTTQTSYFCSVRTTEKRAHIFFCTFIRFTLALIHIPRSSPVDINALSGSTKYQFYCSMEQAANQQNFQRSISPVTVPRSELIFGRSMRIWKERVQNQLATMDQSHKLINWHSVESRGRSWADHFDWYKILGKFDADKVCESYIWSLNVVNFKPPHWE